MSFTTFIRLRYLPDAGGDSSEKCGAESRRVAVVGEVERESRQVGDQLHHKSIPRHAAVDTDQPQSETKNESSR